MGSFLFQKVVKTWMHPPVLHCCSEAHRYRQEAPGRMIARSVLKAQVNSPVQHICMAWSKNDITIIFSLGGLGLSLGTSMQGIWPSGILLAHPAILPILCTVKWVLLQVVLIVLSCLLHCESLCQFLAILDTCTLVSSQDTQMRPGKSGQPDKWTAHAAGFIPIAGNWIGQGLTYSYLLSGQSVLNGAPYPGSARAFASWPSTYLSASYPSQYNQSETIIINQGMPLDRCSLCCWARISACPSPRPSYQLLAEQTCKGCT